MKQRSVQTMCTCSLKYHPKWAFPGSGDTWRKFQFDDLSKVGKYEIQVQEPRILVWRVLCRHSPQERKENKRVHQQSIEGRRRNDTTEYRISWRPFKRVASNMRRRQAVRSLSVSVANKGGLYLKKKNH